MIDDGQWTALDDAGGVTRVVVRAIDQRATAKKVSREDRASTVRGFSDGEVMGRGKLAEGSWNHEFRESRHAGVGAMYKELNRVS